MTTAPRFTSCRTRPLSSRMRTASRTVLRATPSSLAMALSRNRSPGANAPATIRDARPAATCCAAVDRRTTRPSSADMEQRIVAVGALSLQFNCSTVSPMAATTLPGHALWNPQAHMPTARTKRLVITGGQGAWLESSTGQRLLDATASLWHANIGHGRAGLAHIAYEQMRKLETYHTFGRFANEPALRLADRLAEIGPIPGAKVMLTSGGSDSVDLACKLARRHWQLEGRPEKKIILSRIG